MKYPVSTTAGGKSTCLAPDTCFLEAPPPYGAPGPMLNAADHSGAEKTTKNVLVVGKQCLLEGSTIPSSKGDELGTHKTIPAGIKGIKSRKNKDKCEMMQFSSKVKMEGKGVVCHTARTKHNDGNTMGKHATPSQKVVLADM